MADYELFFKRRTGRDNSMNEVIDLVTVTETLSNGHYTRTETGRTVFAELKSVTRSEFYQAYMAGLNAALVFRIYTEELGDAGYVDYGDNRYKIQRTYRLDAQYTEITVGEQTGRPTAANAAEQTGGAGAQDPETGAGEQAGGNASDGTTET